ncbi:YqiJ family protein [Paractinoplanes hotanensis]|uniref:YqiJ family protein n=1 Tax=Paractinoplanes hotanensis TaxID=2906497 RepID=A0ABT0YAL2_9ACTN|nr:YqiJ family protein [Actinoplanes hotanensis]MCM4083067.1 YqiJ family protein [Actinoplanes hotanensis]
MSFPTVLFTPLLVVVVGYWLVVIAGGADPDAGSDAGDHGPLHFAGLGGVPVPISLSLVIVFAWFASLAGGEFHGPIPLWAVLIAALGLSWLLARLLIIPIRRLLPDGPDVSRADFVGLTCIIRTGRVTSTFGQAEVHAADGSSAVVQVRQAGADDLHSGSEALLYGFDPDGEFFWVVPTDIATRGH